nr:hypothetical protein [Tanacetum cinerariifolium]
QIDLTEPFNDVYVTPVHTKKVFTNMKRQNKDFLWTITPLFVPMLVPQVVEGEGSGQPSEPQPPSLSAPPSHGEQVTTVAPQPQKTHTPRQAKRGRDTEIPQSSGPPKKVGDKAVYTREYDRVVRAATTATSLEAEQESGSRPRCQDTTLGDADAQTRFETSSKQSHDPPLSEGNTSRSVEDSMAHRDDLTNFIPPTPHDLPLSGGHTSGSDEGVNLFRIGTSRRKSLDKENISKQGGNLKTRIKEGDFDDDFDDMVDKAIENVEGDIVNAAIEVSAVGASVTTAGVSISIVKPRTPPTTTTRVSKNKDLTIAQTLVKMRSEKAKEKGVVFSNVEESARPTTILQLLIQKIRSKALCKSLKSLQRTQERLKFR